jgi:hypothetical protein
MSDLGSTDRLQGLRDHVIAGLGERVLDSKIAYGELTITVARAT